MLVKLGFENFYLYSAVNPDSGEHFTLLLPKVNTDCMNIFLQEFSKKHPEAVIIMDGAGWHKSQNLKIPEGIEINHLPPYSPELNPVERLWAYIKSHTIKNKVFEKLSDLEDTVCEFVKNLSNDVIKSVCKQNSIV